MYILKYNFSLVLDHLGQRQLIVVFYILGSLIGFAAQGMMGSHYQIQIIVPLFVLLGLLFQSLIEHIKNIRLFRVDDTGLYIIAASLIFVFLVIPKKQYFIDYHLSSFNFIKIGQEIVLSEQQQDLKLEQSISAKVDQKECIIHVYGWGVGTTYFYSQRKPCTKLFLANLVNPNKQGAQYARDLLTNPPKALIYDINDADMDIDRFEETVFNYPQVIGNCYVQDAHYQKLYWLKMDNKEIQQECLKKYYI